MRIFNELQDSILIILIPTYMCGIWIHKIVDFNSELCLQAFSYTLATCHQILQTTGLFRPVNKFY